MDCSSAGSSVHRILQSRILEWVATPFSRGFSLARDRTCISYVSRIGRGFLPLVSPGKTGTQDQLNGVLGETFASVILWNFSSRSKYAARAETHCCSRDHAQARPLSESKPPCWYDGLLLFSVLSVTRAPGQGRPPLALNLPQLGCWEIESFSVWNRLRAPGGL